MGFRRKVPGILCLLLILLGFPPSEGSSDESEQHQNRPKVSDPVSNFFSELGDLILDVDQTIAVQSRPKIEQERNIVSQLFKPRNDYFNRIQKNYSDMQKRLGKLIGNTVGFKDAYSDHELSTVNPPLEKFVPTIKPNYNPFAAADEARKGKLKQRVSKESIPEAIPETLKAFGKLSQAIIDDIGDISRESMSNSHSKDASGKRKFGKAPNLEKCSSEVLGDPALEQRRQEKCSRIAAEERARADLRKLMSETKRANEALISASSKAFEQLSEGILGRSGDSLTENDQTSVNENDSKTGRVDSKELLDECLSEALEDATLENIRKQKCARIVAENRLVKDLNKLVLDSRRAGDNLITIGSKAMDDFSSILIKRDGDAEVVENVDDTLFPDLPFDKQIRQLIKDHGSWILDYPFIKRWRQRDRSSGDHVTTDPNFEEMDFTTVESASLGSETEPTEIYVPVSSDYEIALQKSGETVPDSPHQSPYYRIINEDGDVMEEEVEILLEPESFSHDVEVVQIEKQGPKETIILAFTPDGIPLKLRVGPEIDNPLQYLHKMLQSASVSLNIPVESFNDLEPVGKEVLKLGSGILTRAVLIDASNSNELKSLLKGLMASKSSGKTSL